MGHVRIYMHPSGDAAMHHSGFSWTAVIAFPLWALARGLYKTAVIWCGCLLVMSLVLPRLLGVIHGEALRALAACAYIAGYWLAAGFVAGWWHRIVLERRGYFVVAEEMAQSLNAK